MRVIDVASAVIGVITVLIIFVMELQWCADNPSQFVKKEVSFWDRVRDSVRPQNAVVDAYKYARFWTTYYYAQLLARA